MGDMVDKTDAVSVVNLVLQYAGNKGVGWFEMNSIAMNINGAHPHLAIAGNIAVNVFDRQAALLVVNNFALVFNNFWIN